MVFQLSAVPSIRQNYLSKTLKRYQHFDMCILGYYTFVSANLCYLVVTDTMHEVSFGLRNFN